MEWFRKSARVPGTGNTERFAGIRKAFTRLLLLDSAITAFNKANPEQQQHMIRLGMLAALNPDKTRQIKDRLISGGPSPRSRLEELKALHKDGLITESEYEEQKKEILSEL